MAADFPLLYVGAVTLEDAVVSAAALVVMAAARPLPLSSTSSVNLLVMQSGGSTPVLNRSLRGIVAEAEEKSAFGRILGARHAMDGVVEGRLVDLGRYGKTWWRRVGSTPGGVLGSSRRGVREDDAPATLRTIRNNDIRYLFTIGGNDSAENSRRVAEQARLAGIALTVVNVPKTIDTDLVLTDHTPGYGSAADSWRWRPWAPAETRRRWGRRHRSLSSKSWAATPGGCRSAALAKREERDAPHLIAVPEVAIDVDRFLGGIEDAYRRYGVAVAVVAENARGHDGPLGSQRTPSRVDDFGHAYYEGPARYLAALAEKRLGVRVRAEKPGTIQRSMASCLSSTDAAEAEMAGRAAVRYALEGATDRMVTLVRGDGDAYSCTTGLAPLSEVAGRVRTMPPSYLDPGNHTVTDEFLRYARPLIGPPLPRFERLSAYDAGT